MQASDVMTTGVLTQERGGTVLQTAKLMAGQHVGSLIVTAANYPIGIVTETDITKLLAQGHDPARTPVESIMSSPLFSTTPETDLVHIANTMSANNIKKMPVINHGVVVGMITQTDIIRHVLNMCATYTKQDTRVKGSPTVQQFIENSGELFTKLRIKDGQAKHWHMRCRQCDYRFMTAEQAGKLEHSHCPNCGGTIEYDPSPPL